MSWFKRLFSSQSPEGSSQQKLVEDNDSNEPKVYYSTHISTKANVPKKVNGDITESQFQECDENTINTRFLLQLGWSDKEEEEPWWESFKSQSQLKSSERSTQETSFS